MTPLPTQPLITPDRLRRFEAKCIPEPSSGCTLWLGGVNEHGYGVFWNGVRLEKAHRFALRAVGIDVPRTADVLHRCDFPPCVNPDHLYVGDAQENVDDMWAKCRATVLIRHGTAQTQAKLTDTKVAEIRRVYAAGEATQYELAEHYSVCQGTIWRVVNYLNWLSPSGLVIERGRGK